MSDINVLLVDDEEMLRNALSIELIDEGYTVDTATDGDEAIDILRNKNYDVILLDIKMPRVSGFEVLKFVQQKSPKTKVIMLTAYADVKNAIEAVKLGACDFISKPYDLDDVLTSISKALGK
jgi:DNA-binding NtrC family response regulator